MKRLRKRKAEIRRQVHEAVSYFLSPVKNYLEGKWRLSLRIRIINRIMSRRPRYYMKRVLILYGLIFIVTVFTAFHDDNNSKDVLIPEKTVVGVNEIFNKYNHIQNLNRAEREVKQDIAIKTVNILNEADSFFLKQNKTKEDTARIKRAYRQLEIIHRNIK